mmetsp:Transcript_11863/g.14450  ORF Transcript_11863/g.14450 Transcript_11863/m.14450 type:complete len:234 (-) Transcript_11863:90-791(-)
MSKVDAYTGSKNIDSIKVCLSCQGLGTLKQTDISTSIVREVECSRCQGEGVLGRVKKKEKSDAILFKEAGDRYLRRGDFGIAINKYNAALDLEPNQINAVANRALAYFQLSDYQNAEMDATFVIDQFGSKEETNPMYIRSLLRRGLARARLEQSQEKALDDLTKVLTLQPGHPLATEEASKLRNMESAFPPNPPNSEQIEGAAGKNVVALPSPPARLIVELSAEDDDKITPPE